MGKATGQHPTNRLSALGVKNEKRPGRYADGNGLYLVVDPTGAKRWMQRITVGKKRCDIGLGSAAVVSLARAREKALENKSHTAEKRDPLALKRAAQEAERAAAALPTFKALAKDVHAFRLPSYRSAKAGAQWISSLTEYVFPIFGAKPVNEVTAQHVLAALSPILHSKPETAQRVRQRISAVFKHAIALRHRFDNPVEDLKATLPKRDMSKVEHHRALPYADVAVALNKVRGSDASEAAKLAFEFLVLTATRSGETRGALWGEIDLEKATWTIPASRMKAKKPHRVPLSERSLAILKAAKPLKDSKSDYVFPGTVAGKPLSDSTLSKLLRELSIEAVPHGFRSSFRDWAGEQTNFPREVVEFALAHVIKDKAEKAYARSDLFDKRSKLMSAWSNYLKLTGSKVIHVSNMAA